MTRTIVQTEEAPAAIGPYSQALCIDNFIFVSGQIPLDPATGTLIDGDITAQTHQVLRNVQGVLRGAGSSLQEVAKTTVFLTDINDFATVNAIYGEYFSDAPPARSAMQVAALPKGAQVEIEAIAVRTTGKTSG